MNMNSFWVQVLIGALFFGYTGYFSFKSYLLNKTYKEGLEKFKESHKHIEEFSESKKWVIISSIMTLMAVLSAVFADKFDVASDQLVYYRIAYVALAIMFLGLALETNVRKRIWFSDDGFFFVDQYYRYRMIVHYNDKKSLGVFRNSEVLMANKDKLSVSGKMADQIREREVQWKEKKKQRKHK